ncbi:MULTISPECIES: ATP-dependent nuclease [Yersinia]|uniref:ATP-dependent nuclease n=1 Tax=Yersinia TaxID=629 RepID=UPI0005DE3E9F|nr:MULTISPECIES: AAA family ATPase [Yersinia]EKN3970971.1 AAA family ATPase [Yersinia enterocolitica]EKN4720580.1 AAA family ATPase [Yersinia enterocolitica]EKN4732690.1 AAA family ATPase [Yersinia enterocolitica]MBO1591322.1 AAA family ATPase [Yersinia pseudotuberculosis]CQJ15290.1 SMC (structural maintenance of chromosomes) family protein [Yersinia enterocolitica]
MYLHTIKINGFKCFDNNFSIELSDGLNVLVGENGAGKTAIISAIRQLFNDSESGKRAIRDRDFYRSFIHNAVAAESIHIEATFTELNQDESTAFIDWCGQEPEAKLTFSAANRESRGHYRHQIWGGAQRIKPVEIEVLDLIHCIYLPPLRDAEVKLREGRQSRLARLLKALCRKELEDCRKAGAVHPLEQRVGAFNKELAESEDYAIKQANQRIGDNLKEALGMNLSQSTIIQFSEVNFSKIVEGLRLLYYPDLSDADATQFRSLEENSLGYNNLLYIASILAELILDVEEEQVEKTYLRLLLIEEPEAHLHPQLQIRLLRHLKAVAEARGIQVIITTHSTVISSAVSINNIIHISRADKPTAIPLRHCGLPDASRRFIDRWLDVTKSNLLFSKGVILVEGIAEAIVVPELARIVLQAYGKGRDSLDDYGVSVINLNGIYFNHFMQLFCDVKGTEESRSIPVRCAGLTDNDPPKSIEKIVNEEGKETSMPYLPHAEAFQAGNNPALTLIPLIAQSQYARLYAGKYKTFEYDIALEGNNLRKMFEIAAAHWPTRGPVEAVLRASSELSFAEMPNAEKAEYAWYLLQRIDSDDMGKGLYAQVLADALVEHLEDFVVPEYIREAILWACNIPQEIVA